MQRRRSIAAIATLVTLAACASSPPSSPSTVDAAVRDAAPAADTSTVADVARATDAPAPVDVPVVAEDVPVVAGPYPDGPYGNREGDVLANLAWQGYVNESGEEVSTALPFGDTSLQALRGNGRGYALIQVSEFL